VTATTQAPGDQIPLRRNRNFQLLWSGLALSDFGSSMTALALPLTLLAVGYDTATVGVIGTIVVVVGLIARMPAGYLVDHFDHRRQMLICDLARMLTVGAVAIVLFLRPLPLALALAMVIVSITAQEIYGPSQSMVMREIVPKDQLIKAMSINQARSYGASIAAPAVAGPLLAIRLWIPFAFDALTFGVSTLSVILLGRGRTPLARPATRHKTDGETFVRRFTAGWRYMARDRFLRRAVFYSTLANPVFSAFGYALILGAVSRPGHAAAVGAAISTAAVAGLVGSLIAPYLKNRLSLGVAFAIGPMLAALLLGVASWTGGVIPFAAAFSAICLFVPAGGALFATAVATTVPKQSYGRVAAASGFLGQLLQPFGPAMAGLLLAHLSFNATAGTFAIAEGALACVALAIPAPAPTSPPPTEPGIDDDTSSQPA
jgi:MFS family permease